MGGALKKLPIGIDDFEKLNTRDFYYVDKTGLIAELIENQAEVTLFTRPRRFGKSLNMSMLNAFFSFGGERSVFDGLEISRISDISERYMGCFPVIFVSLKDVSADNYETAKAMLIRTVNRTVRKVQYLAESEALMPADRKAYEELLDRRMGEDALSGSLLVLSELLEIHHRHKVIILIDEYDVPLAKAHEYGYYDQMAELVRNIFSQALKGNTSLEFAVLTGCMRIARESIFTGLNNLKIRSVTDTGFGEYFGFTDDEVRKLLGYYGFADKYGKVKDWYDGYRFGNENVYCPWDVLNYCAGLMEDPSAEPQNYWINTSGNDAVKKFVGCSENANTRHEIERLVDGDEIVRGIRSELTYKDMYASVDNMWSVLLATGYLTWVGRGDADTYRLRIPNQEIRNIFSLQIMEYFRENVRRDTGMLDAFCLAMENGDAAAIEAGFEKYLQKTMSIRDTYVRKDIKENFYHGVLLGILGVREDWRVVSNRETGEGYGDILVVTDKNTGIVIEIKYAHDGDFDASCKAALKQIDEKRYMEAFRWDNISRIFKMGISCFAKRCRVCVEPVTGAAF